MLILDVPPQRLSRTSFMQAALRQALRSNCRFPMGAILTQGNRVLASAPNKKRNSPMIDYRHSTFHAEEAVLRRVSNTEGATIYVARVNARRQPAMAKPCGRCQQAMLQAGVRRVFYTSHTGVVQGMVLLQDPM
ncbi:deaminase [Streptomyces sp900105245]|uniref:Deaminase n=1 Tax=Streptomyces sp. 900105245 TaxID=3154379 RepID=A0ABV1UK44_9ACTN